MVAEHSSVRNDSDSDYEDWDGMESTELDEAFSAATPLGLVLGLLLYPIALKYILQICEWSINTTSAEARRYYEIGRSLIFVASLGIVLIVIVWKRLRGHEMATWSKITKHHDYAKLQSRLSEHLCSLR
ncbi:hypothetical protein JHK82_050761 [Glycine max]|nr:hypothetical protein JHK82_050761 [Glycine max]